MEAGVFRYWLMPVITRTRAIKITLIIPRSLFLIITSKRVTSYISITKRIWESQINILKIDREVG